MARVPTEAGYPVFDARTGKAVSNCRSGQMAYQRVALPSLVLSQSGAIKYEPQATIPAGPLTNQSIPEARSRASDAAGRSQ